MAKIETSSKLIQVRIYEDHADNYVATFFIFKDGEHGVISGLNGNHFYKNIIEIFKILLKDYGIKYVHGSVTEAHARLIRMHSKEFEVIYVPTICENRKMVWITACKS